MPDQLNDDVRQAWEANAAWWDEQIGPEGNMFHRQLVAPAQMRLLTLAPGERVLDVACGNGQFAREMAAAGVRVVAFDFSREFIARALRHTKEAGIAGIEYHVIDATDERQLLSLGERSFDAAVCTMALMDMADIGPLLRALARLLKPDGRFVFSVMHPCFNSPGVRLAAEIEDRDGRLEEVRSVRVVRYLAIPPERGLGIVGQPQPHHYFHRPLSALFGACLAAGFALDGLEEPAWAGDEDSAHWFAWARYPQVPPVLVARMRLCG